MSPLPYTLFPSRQRARPLVVLLALAVGLTAGLMACDSGGSSEEDPPPEEELDVAETFTVTVESIEGTDYPYSEENNVGVAYAIDGEVGAVLSLERGKTYEFELGSSVGDGPNGQPHPFYVGETAEGQGGDEFRDDPAKQTSGVVLFTPPSNAPDSLFYQCNLHRFMGGKMEIVDASGDDSGGNY